MRMKKRNPVSASADDLVRSRDKFDALVQESMVQLISQMEELNGQGWVKPWKDVPGTDQPPYNPVTGHRYTRGNALLLMIQGFVRGYGDPRYLTFKQCEAFGPDVHVRKGERGITLLRPMVKEVEDAPEERDPDELVTPDLAFVDPQPSSRKLVFFRPYTVFNAEQIDGLPALSPSDSIQAWDDQDTNPVEIFVAASGAVCRHGGNRAYYSPLSDHIQLPPKASFDLAEQYYATKAHEFYHWTGAASRADRGLIGRSDPEHYAFEELRAETFSLLVGKAFGLPFDLTEHAAYIEHWKNSLKNDSKTLFAAAVEASSMLEVVLDVVAGKQPTPSWFPHKDTWPLHGESHEEECMVAQTSF